MFTSPALKCTWLLIPTIPAKISSTGNFGTPHDFLSRPSSWFRISRFLPLKGWQVRKLDTPWCLHKMIPCIGVSALRALVIRVTIKQIMGKRDHQGDRENGKCRFVPCAQEFLYLSLTVHYVHKKYNSFTSVLCKFLSAHFLFWEIVKLNLAFTVNVRRIKANPESLQSAFVFSFLPYPQGIYCSQARLTTHTPKPEAL